LPGVFLQSLAGTSDGGVLAAGTSTGAFVTRLTGDGGSVWSFMPGSSNTTAMTVAAAGSRFALAGFNSGSGDFDPGAGIDVVFGDIIYVSRFNF
jgi:hypothetical protein